MAKSGRTPFQKTRTKAKIPLEKIHTDIKGPIVPLSFPGENKFIIIFLDDDSTYARIFLIKTKDRNNQCAFIFLYINYSEHLNQCYTYT